MEIKEAIERYTSNAEYERSHGSLQGCLEFRQLAEWLKDYKRLLEREPCREIEDYENEIEDLHNRLDIAEYDKERLREEVTNLEEKIKALEQEPKTGHWIRRNAFLVPWKCSECNYESERYDNYCPNCGAKMVKPQESKTKQGLSYADQDTLMSAT